MRLFLSIALAVSLLSVRAACACGSAGNSSGLYAVALASMVVAGGGLAGDIVFSIHDLVDPHPSRGSGIGESLLAAPQVLIGVGVLTSYRDTGGRVGAAVYTAWMSALFIHGIHTIVTVRPGGLPDAPDEAEEARLRTPGLGLGMTFVDVGQKSAPGLGVVGRF